MTLPYGDLEVLREYSCGCIVYRDEKDQRFDEEGLWCDARPSREKMSGVWDTPHGLPTRPQHTITHKARLVKGTEEQISLFGGNHEPA